MNVRLGLVPGQRYRLSFEDCCVTGEFNGTFLRWEYDGSPEAPSESAISAYRAIFDTGALEGIRWEAEELPACRRRDMVDKTPKLEERRVVETLKALCPQCKVALVVEEPGSETARWVRCPECNDYLYYVGNIACCGNGVILMGATPEAITEIKGALGSPAPLPWVVEYTADMRRKAGLKD